MLGAVTALAMSVAAWLVSPPQPVTDAALGICLPSPSQWNVVPVSAWIVNTVAVLALAALMVLLGRTYNFTRGNGNVFPVVFLVMTASDPWLMTQFGTPTLLCAAAMACMWLLASAYKSDNATQQVFVAATLISIGSMAEYAFLVLVPACIASMAALKVFRWRELTALAMGLCAPYWICLGFGWVDLADLRVPQLHCFAIPADWGPSVYPQIAGVLLAMVFGLMTGLNSFVRFYAGNSRILALNGMVMMLGMCCMGAMIVDTANAMAYQTTLYLAVGVQVANVFGMWPMRRPGLLLAVYALIYVLLFIFTLA